jgi:hypothetical protein
MLETWILLNLVMFDVTLIAPSGAYSWDMYVAAAALQFMDGNILVI